MGLSPNTAPSIMQPAVSQAATGILDPRTGQPIGADDRYFLEINSELSFP